MKFFLFLLASAAVSFLAIFAVSSGSPAVFMTAADPLVRIAVIGLSIAGLCFIAGWITGDYSWVDRIWSILPAVYSWIYAASAWPDARLIVMSLLITAWAARLTFNFARKGGYSGVEDYRWEHMRKKIPGKFAWQAFNLGFISFYQNLLFVLFTLPVYAAWIDAGTGLGPLDYAAAGLFLLFLAGETAADRQQWNFHLEKKRVAASGETATGDAARGFLTSGLFRYSRHPNFFCEQGMWWSIYLFAVSASGSWLHWSGIGAALLTLLFQGSTDLTERLSAGKYPEYGQYQKTTSRLIPWFPSRDPE